jgi:hypothetical protein
MFTWYRYLYHTAYSETVFVYVVQLGSVLRPEVQFVLSFIFSC